MAPEHHGSCCEGAEKTSETGFTAAGSGISGAAKPFGFVGINGRETVAPCDGASVFGCEGNSGGAIPAGCGAINEVPISTD